MRTIWRFGDEWRADPRQYNPCDQKELHAQKGIWRRFPEMVHPTL